MSEQHNFESNEKDVRVGTTRKIWGMATGMLAMSVPLCAMTHTGALIPLAVLAAVAVGTVSVWSRRGPAIARIAAPEAAAQKRIHELEERLANLEAITNLEQRLLEAKYPAVEPAPVASSTRPTPRPISS